MPSWYIHTILNVVIFIPILLFLKIFLSEFLLLIIVWGVLIDLDHLPYYMLKFRTFDFSKILKFSNRDFKSDTVHFYPLHTLEFFIILSIAAVLAKFDTRFILIVLTGLVHWILDGVRHYMHHKNFSWLQYYSAIYYFFRNVIR